MIGSVKILRFSLFQIRKKINLWKLFKNVLITTDLIRWKRIKNTSTNKNLPAKFGGSIHLTELVNSFSALTGKRCLICLLIIRIIWRPNKKKSLTRKTRIGRTFSKTGNEHFILIVAPARADSDKDKPPKGAFFILTALNEIWFSVLRCVLPVSCRLADRWPKNWTKLNKPPKTLRFRGFENLTKLSLWEIRTLFCSVL